MRRAIRVDRSVDLLRLRTAVKPTSPYLCSSCNYQATSFSTSSSRSADKKLPFTEKLRRRIWGTDQPPGLADPYGGPSIWEKSRQKAQEKREEAAAAVEPQEGKRTLKTLADIDPSYEPATTWDGLERVGGFGHWWKENWDPDHPYEGFLPRTRHTDSNAIIAALHRAMVEVFALQEAGIPLSGISRTISTLDPTKDVQILPSATGATLQFSPTSSLDKVVESLSATAGETDETAVKENPSESEADVAADRSSVDPLHPEAPEEVDETVTKGNPSESEADVAADRSTVDPNARNKPTEGASKTKYADVNESWGAAWLGVSLDNPEIKFAVLKRTMQLTGIRIPDPVIISSNTAQALLKHLIAPPKPRKVNEALIQKSELAELPNVSVYARRRTPVHKERSVGRWKVIEKELRERGLPVFGKEEMKGAGLSIYSRSR